MPKLNRGNTAKLSIRLSSRARQNIDIAAENLGISSGGVILFELTKILKSPPSLSELDDMENRITLERKHFVVTIKEELMTRINEMAEDYGIKKNVLIGLIVSDHFENLADLQPAEKSEPKKLMVQVNESLKKKMMEYSEEHFIPFSGLVSYSILEGPYEGLPSYEDRETVQFFTNVPEYVGDIVKEEADAANIKEHFYTSLCLYKQFMTPEGRFYNKD